MLSFNPYFNFSGNTEQAMRFYKSVFGGEFTNFQRFSDIPGNEKLPAEDQGKIMHISLEVKKDMVLMATDTLASMHPALTSGNNFHINIIAESEAEADKIFEGLSEDGKVEMPLNKTFWGAYFGMCRDKFGISWMINYTYPQNQ